MCMFQSGWSVHAKLQSGFDSQTAGQKHGGDARRVSTKEFPIKTLFAECKAQQLLSLFCLTVVCKCFVQMIRVNMNSEMKLLIFRKTAEFYKYTI